MLLVPFCISLSSEANKVTNLVNTKYLGNKVCVRTVIITSYSLNILTRRQRPDVILWYAVFLWVYWCKCNYQLRLQLVNNLLACLLKLVFKIKCYISVWSWFLVEFQFTYFKTLLLHHSRLLFLDYFYLS